VNSTGLIVIGDYRVRRVLISRDRATGVVVERDGSREDFEAGEILLCAGALVSAHDLHLSRIGPRDILESIGVEVVKDLRALARDSAITRRSRRDGGPGSRPKCRPIRGSAAFCTSR
jgi:choline dehydrogenase-like flavoprotein